MYVLILASFAVGLIIRYILFLLSDTFDLFDKRIQVAQQVWVQAGPLTLTNIFFWVAPTSIGLVVALSLLLNFTSLGRQMRALADNATLAKVIGVPTGRVVNLTWVLAGGLAGVGGALWGIYTFVDPMIGWLAILSVFAAVVLGGLTSFPGTILGAYVVAFAENTLMQALNYWFGLDFSFKPAVPFVIIIVVLLIRPQGLTGLFCRYAPRCRIWSGRRMNINLVSTGIALLTFFGIAAIMALSLNIEYGVAGIPNFGQALFVAIGAYSAGVTYTRLMPLLAGRAALEPCGATNMAPALALRGEILKTMPAVALGNFALTLLIAAVIGGVVGLVASYPALRLKEEWFLGLVLLVGSETVRIFVRGYEPIICAHNGLSGISQPLTWLGTPQMRSIAFAGLVLVIAAVCYWYSERLVRSPYGRLLKALRENNGWRPIWAKTWRGSVARLW